METVVCAFKLRLKVVCVNSFGIGNQRWKEWDTSARFSSRHCVRIDIKAALIGRLPTSRLCHVVRVFSRGGRSVEEWRVMLMLFVVSLHVGRGSCHQRQPQQQQRGLH